MISVFSSAVSSKTMAASFFATLLFFISIFFSSFPALSAILPAPSSSESSASPRRRGDRDADCSRPETPRVGAFSLRRLPAPAVAEASAPDALSKVARPRPRRAAPVRAPSSLDFRAAWRPGPRRALLGRAPSSSDCCLPTARGTRRRTTATATAAAGILSRCRLILTEVAAAAGGVAFLLEFLLHVQVRFRRLWRRLVGERGLRKMYGFGWGGPRQRVP